MTVKTARDSERKLYFDAFDLMLKHKETHGTLAFQSFPLNEVLAERKLELLAKDDAERISPTM